MKNCCYWIRYVLKLKRKYLPHHEHFFRKKAMYTQKIKQKNGRKCKRNKANIKKSKAKQNKVFITKTN